MRRLLTVLTVFVGLLGAPATAQSNVEEELPPEHIILLNSLSPKSGDIEIPSANATLELGDEYVFYDRSDAKDILTDLWGNPPESVSYVLGMVMPAGSKPTDDSWGAVISFEDIGFVSDDDAAEVDYDELLETLKASTKEASDAYAEAGYGRHELVGWAVQPKYNASNHSIVWAQEVNFEDSEDNTLNYDVRTLGRYGVLSVNLVASMSQLDEIRVAANDFASHARFNEGARYRDFDESTDAVAEYGIGGLIAAGAGVAAAKKFGLLALLIKFLKPILVGVVAFAAIFRKRIGRVLGRDRA
jgi:uncharacterized membrane-anchored protein